MKLYRLGIAVMALMMACVLSGREAQAQQNDEKAKYIFLFIGDGMGATHVAAAESYLSYKDGKLGGTMLTMTSFPYYGTATSHSANRNITDSSASGTAISCGEKANNYTLGVNAEGEPIRSMSYDLKDEGYQIGIISTVPINHATPGAFYANSKSRYDYYNISTQIAGTGFDFFAGSGFIDFKGKDQKEEPIDAYLERYGYEVSYGIEEFKKESEGKDKVIFCQESNRSESAGNYVSEGKIIEDATLGQMLDLGLDFFDTEKPFFFMCEGGKIDWTAHGNRTMPMVMDVLEFDDAIAKAYEFYKNNPEETLIVVTADHETGGLTLGCGDSTINWEKLEKQWLDEGKKNTLSDEDNRKLNQECSIGWTTGSHTGGPVPVFAVGKGAEKFAGRMDNTEFKVKILGE